MILYSVWVWNLKYDSGAAMLEATRVVLQGWRYAKSDLQETPFGDTRSLARFDKLPGKRKSQSFGLGGRVDSDTIKPIR